MKLSSIELEAFFEVARERHFTRAAKKVGITQSALSQRVKQLEERLGQRLFDRSRAGAEVTDAGARLLTYCRGLSDQEQEFLGSFGKSASRRGADESVTGELRVAGFSSVMRSVVMGRLAAPVRKNTALKIEILSREMGEIEGLLRGGAVDLAILDYALSDPRFEAIQIGEEENVLIESTRKDSNAAYLDHDPSDVMTFRFLEFNGKKVDPQMDRRFLDEIYSLIDGVGLGWGRAVVPRHLLAGRTDVREAKGWKAMRVPYYLHRARKPYYSRAERLGFDSLKSG